VEPTKTDVNNYLLLFLRVQVIASRICVDISKHIPSSQPLSPLSPLIRFPPIFYTKVARNAYKVTDEDIEFLKSQGYSEDALFEITLSAALGAGMVRLDSGLAALKGALYATEKH
jgi:hypothetical protein